ncbi:MAG TPA: YeeE/YedE family protein [Gammaproteobacteria bacterium]|nr:YeeE/YedE family protein [Gammaproteobacteria bacterium]
MEDLNVWLVGGGLGVGLVFGVLAQRMRFCMVAATGNWLSFRDNRQLSAILAAFLVAIGGTQYLELSGWIPIDEAAYRNAQFDWLGVILGGLIFGIGASLAGGCAARTLVKSTEGNLHSLLALFSFMIFAAITQFGWLEPVRLSLTAQTAVVLEAEDAGLFAVLGLPALWVAIAACVVVLAVLAWEARRGINWSYVVGGAMIGALVVVSWIITGDLAQDEFDPRHPSAITMSGPMARFGYLLTGRVPALSFAISFVIGVAIASLLSALLARDFHIIKPRKGMIPLAITGGAMMGIGGILAYGCNIGQGLSGASTLSLESLLAVLGMATGTFLGVKWWDHRSA